MTASGDAVHASFRRDSSDLTAERITLLFPAAEDRAESRIAAARGFGNMNERRFTALGGIRAEQAGRVARTSEASYSAADGFIRGDQPVEVRAGLLTVRGPGFTLEPKSQVMHIEGGTQAVAGGEAR